MPTTTNAQMELLDSLIITTPTNDFLERFDHAVDWKPIAQAYGLFYGFLVLPQPAEVIFPLKIFFKSASDETEKQQWEVLAGTRDFKRSASPELMQN